MSTITTTPPRQQKRKWPLFAIPIALLIGIGLGSIGNDPTPAPVTVTTTPAPTPVPVLVPDDARTHTPVPDPYANRQNGPLTTFDDGTYEVGTGDGQIAPGKYKTPGPGSFVRLKHNDGAIGDIIDIQISDGPMILTVKASDGYVTVRDCTFTKA